MQKQLIASNPILKKTIEFSLLAVDYCELPDAGRKYVISRQLLKCATSVGANAMESQNSGSKAGFIPKIKIAAKEAHKVQYRLTLCGYSPGCSNCDQQYQKLTEIQKILNSILGTATRKSSVDLC